MRIIAGRWRGHRIQAPPGRHTRPTADRVREAWMSALTPLLPGARALDLFAGSGALGLELLSRGAAHVTFVEISEAALRVLRANVQRLGADGQVRIVRADALRYVEGLEPFAFDLALADPPYGKGLAAALIQRFAEKPFARWLWVEHGADEVLPSLPEARTRRYGDTGLTSIPALA
jgi:16S rRNA (guanine966-N2)-methyltransferase